MALPTTDPEWVTWLSLRHDAEKDRLREYNSLYEGTAPLMYMNPELLAEVGDRISPVSLGWPMIAVDPLEERLDLLAFRYTDNGNDVDDAGDDLDDEALVGDENLRRVWVDNDLPAESSLAHLDALVMTRAFSCVGINEDDADVPLVSMESPLEMYADIDPRNRQIRAALRRWSDQQSLTRLPENYATLYLPDENIYYEGSNPGAWKETGRNVHNYGRVMVSQITNRSRLANQYGRSELTPPLLSLSNAANKIATDMMVGSEFHAFPLRALFGVGPEDLVDQDGNRVSALKAIMGKLLAIGAVDGAAVKAHEFAASSLTNFHDSLNQLAHHAAGLLGLDAHEFGFSTENPASAEALRARETRLVKRAERKQVAFSAGWRRTMSLVRQVQEGGAIDPRTKRLEVIWRDAATPTRAQAADAATKLLTARITTKRQAREDVGYTPGQIRRMEADDEAEAQRSPVAALARGLSDQRVIPDDGPVDPAA